MGTFVQDVKYALRMLVKNPSFALIAILTIMILSPNFDEIGAYLTAIFIAMLIISYLSTSTTRSLSLRGIVRSGCDAGVNFSAFQSPKSFSNAA